MEPRVLLIDDDPAVQELATIVLTESGFQVDVVGDGPDPRRVAWDRYHLVLLDIGLPTADGIEICRSIRERSRVPIVMLTSRDGAGDVVAGLDAGADDYVTKPFVAEVLAARVRAAVRRQMPGAGEGRLAVRDLVVDEFAFRAFRGGEELDLTSTEMRLLTVFVRNVGLVLDRGRLLDEVWGYDYLGDSRLVDMAVMRLRSKLRREGDDAEYVATVRGAGYRLDP